MGPDGMKGFRPLVGIMVLIKKSKNPSWQMVGSFRPLVGIMVLISVRPVSGMSETSRIVSVPLWGLWFLSNPCVNLIQMNGACFRPLVGIMVLIAFYAEEVDFLTNRVSVPLWGLWFLSRRIQKILRWRIRPVSVPLWGLWFLSTQSV